MGLGDRSEELRQRESKRPLKYLSSIHCDLILGLT